jgi:CheY-like chemotaxis protein
LLVEDNVDAREAMTASLEGEGYVVAGAANGQEALIHLRTSPVFCVILLDLGTPAMDGWEFWAKQVREPAMASVPVVIMSLEGLLAQRDGATARRWSYPLDRSSGSICWRPSSIIADPRYAVRQ